MRAAPSMPSLRRWLWFACFTIWLSGGASLLQSAPSERWLETASAVALAIALPMGLARLRKQFQCMRGQTLNLVLFCGLYLIPALLVGRGDLRVPLLLLALSSAGSQRLEDSRVAACIALGSAVLPLLLLCLAPHWTQLLLVPLGLMLGVVNFVMLHGELVRQRYWRVQRSVAGNLATRSRQQLALLLGALVLLGSGAVLLLRTQVGAVVADATQAEAAPAQADLAEQDQETVEGLEAGQLQPSRSGFDTDLEFGGGGGAATSDEPAFSVRVSDGPQAQAGEILYLRGRVLDTFTESGMTLGEPIPRWRDDGLDGRADGWVQLEVRSSLTPRTLEFTHSIPFTLPGDAGEIAFLPPNVISISGRRARYGRDSFCTLDRRVAGTKRYAVLYDPELPLWNELARGRAERGDPRFEQLPDDSPGLQGIQRLAQEWIPASGSDLQRISSLMQRLRTDFEYDLEGTGFSGTAGLLTFLERGSGYCSYFASSAVLMLRTQGIPARVATGFVAKEQRAPGGSWIVRRRHGHAWVEVPFEGLGWVTFDPTPGRSGRAGEGVLADRRSSGWLSQVQSWSQGEQDFGQLIGGLLVSSLREVRSRPSLLLLGVAGLLALLAYARRPLPSGRSPSAPSLPRHEADLLRRLMTALAQRGYRAQDGQSALSLARQAARREGDVFAQLPWAMEQFYRAAFGTRPLESDELTLLEQRIQAWEQTRGDQHAKQRSPSPS